MLFSPVAAGNSVATGQLRGLRCRDRHEAIRLLRIGSLAGLGFATALAGAGTPVAAASFDCSRARAPDEEAVCRNSTLSALDSEMGGLWYAYSRTPMLMGGNSARRDEAQDFLDRRRACGRRVAIESAYRARITTLKFGINRAMDACTAIVHGRER